MVCRLIMHTMAYTGTVLCGVGVNIMHVAMCVSLSGVLNMPAAAAAAAVASASAAKQKTYKPQLKYPKGVNGVYALAECLSACVS